MDYSIKFVKIIINKNIQIKYKAGLKWKTYKLPKLKISLEYY